MLSYASDSTAFPRYHWAVLPAFAFGLVLFLKISVVHLPDFLAAALCVHGLCFRKVHRMVFRSGAILLVLAAMLSLVTGTLNSSGAWKPYWPYHVLRIVLYFLAAYDLGFSETDSDRRFAKWVEIWACAAAVLSLLVVASPDLQALFMPLKMRAFWTASGDAQATDPDLSFRSSGIFSCYLEAGNVMAFGFLVAIGQMLQGRSVARMTLHMIVVLLLAGSLVAIAFRTAAVMVIVGTGVAVVLAMCAKGGQFLKVLRLPLAGLGCMAVLAFVWPWYESYTSHIDIDSRLSFMSHAVRFVASGELDTSAQTTFTQIFFPEDFSTWVFGQGLQPWSDGVRSDVGYIQMLWELGLLGCLAFAFFYGSLMILSWRTYRWRASGLAISLLAIALACFGANVKGQYLVGIRSGDLLACMFGIVLGNASRRRTTRPRTVSSTQYLDPQERPDDKPEQHPGKSLPVPHLWRPRPASGLRPSRFRSPPRAKGRLP